MTAFQHTHHDISWNLLALIKFCGNEKQEKFKKTIFIHCRGNY